MTYILTGLSSVMTVMYGVRHTVTVSHSQIIAPHYNLVGMQDYDQIYVSLVKLEYNLATISIMSSLTNGRVTK